MFYSVDILRTKAQETASQTALRDCVEEAREETRYIGVLQKKTPGSQNVERLLFPFLKKYLFIYLAVPGLSCSMRDLVP